MDGHTCRAAAQRVNAVRCIECSWRTKVWDAGWRPDCWDSLAGQLYATLLGLFKGPRLCGGIARVDFRRNDFLTIGTGPQAAQQAVP